MTHTISRYMTRRLPPIAAAAVLTALSAIGCSGSPLASAPFAPSAIPAMALSAETGDTEAAATFDALDKGKDKGKGGDRDGTTTGGTPTATQTVVEAEGAVVTVTGTCPAKTFTIGLHSITTNAATVYDDGLCAELVALAKIEVRATRQADGTLLATRVEFDATDADDDDDDDADEDGDEDDAEDDDAEDGRGNPHHGAGPHSGTVSSFRGACPAVNFNLKGLRVSTTAATTYAGGTCETLRPNVHVTVTGTAGTTSRTFVAATVTILRTH